MKSQFFVIACLIGEKERQTIKVNRSQYRKIRKKLFICDRKNVKRKSTMKNYPIIKLGIFDYVIYACIKVLKIEEVEHLVIEKLFNR